MGEFTTIAWCDHTMNPWVGCQRVSPGCVNCYAETRDVRWAKGVHWGPRGTRQVTTDANWRKPVQWNQQAQADGTRARVFCASLADVFEDHPDLVEPRDRLVDLIEETRNLDWLLLTKRIEHVMDMVPGRWSSRFPENVWIGTSVEDQRRADERIPYLIQVPATVRFLSCEPLLERVELHSLNEIDWVIIGGESGPGARYFDLQWARDIVSQCRTRLYPPAVFYKQGGSHHGCVHSGKGECIECAPEDLRIREFPT